MTRNYDLIIFDCDGTLVDSEYLNNKVSSNLLIEFGLAEYTPEKFMSEFVGCTWTNIKNDIEARHNVKLPADIIDRYVEVVNKELEKGVEPIEGVMELLNFAQSNFKICVGSNGQRSNVMKSLHVQGFDAYFQDTNIFTRIQVPNGKPAPDLFLFAAAQMDVEPFKCLVIEDSPTGVQAGVAAGMDVWGFVGTSHTPDTQAMILENAGANRVFDSLIHISQALNN